MGAPFRTPGSRDALRARMEKAIDRLIAALDALDAVNEDVEDGADTKLMKPMTSPRSGSPRSLICSQAAIKHIGPRAAVSRPMQRRIPATTSRRSLVTTGSNDCELGDDNGIADADGLWEQLGGLETSQNRLKYTCG